MPFLPNTHSDVISCLAGEYSISFHSIRRWLSRCRSVLSNQSSDQSCVSRYPERAQIKCVTVCTRTKKNNENCSRKKMYVDNKIRKYIFDSAHSDLYYQTSEHRWQMRWYLWSSTFLVPQIHHPFFFVCCTRSRFSNHCVSKGCLNETAHTIRIYVRTSEPQKIKQERSELVDVNIFHEFRNFAWWTY